MGQYRHYGSSKFDIDIFEPITNHPYRNKPFGGLWAEPKNSQTRGWRYWCESEDFNTNRLRTWFDFSIDSNAKVFDISDRLDIIRLSDLDCCNLHIYVSNLFDEDYNYNVEFIDFEKLMQLGYDAMSLCINSFTYWAMYGWDCDSIIVLNPEVICV